MSCGAGNRTVLRPPAVLAGSRFKRHSAFTEALHPCLSDNRDYVNHIHLHAQTIPLPGCEPRKISDERVTWSWDKPEGMP
jgi:hypothetical protein